MGHIPQLFRHYVQSPDDLGLDIYHIDPLLIIHTVHHVSYLNQHPLRKGPLILLEGLLLISIAFAHSFKEPIFWRLGCIIISKSLAFFITSNT